jgi:GT2 family glycosyltransferase
MNVEPMSHSPIVIAVVATFKRPASLAELLNSLAAPHTGVAHVVVVDNGSDPATKRVTEEAPVPVRYLDPGVNLSCGGGTARALHEALTNPDATHFWILDDDAKAFPGAMQTLAAALDETGADAAVPIIVDESGHIAWHPGLLERAARLLVQSRCTPAEYLAAHGPRPVRFSWSPWPSIMVTRKAIEKFGFPRDDFWLTGEDVEFSLRITQRGQGIFVPTAICAHLPPGGDSPRAHAQHYLKFCTVLQNATYISIHLRHGWRILRHMPGNYWRFFKTFGVSWRSLRDAAHAFWWGAIRGKTAGQQGFTEFRERFFAIP